jgi:hypothetical protein
MTEPDETLPTAQQVTHQRIAITTYGDQHPTIHAENMEWHEVGQDLDVDPEAWLKAHIVICGVDMHLEAIEVTIGYDGIQEGICPNLDEILCEYAGACGADGHFQTMYRGGHEYAIFATPYC